ncbi:hypothetical protein K466DRAFT_164443 [Polyporus arcularius HHB13444]|uniref:Uncharacterized protein n=1 Tax=Polyporus arcularius HHB13444 TaxID=1314778 RepID=A0A5C3PCZ0_9APHY|nr:hypothetical protein K466DRAFT_164443 [Polyporus arcularius HHB13444]
MTPRSVLRGVSPLLVRPLPLLGRNSLEAASFGLHAKLLLTLSRLPADRCSYYLRRTRSPYPPVYYVSHFRNPLYSSVSYLPYAQGRVEQCHAYATIFRFLRRDGDSAEHGPRVLYDLNPVRVSFESSESNEDRYCVLEYLHQATRTREPEDGDIMHTYHVIVLSPRPLVSSLPLYMLACKL